MKKTIFIIIFVLAAAMGGALILFFKRPVSLVSALAHIQKARMEKPVAPTKTTTEPALTASHPVLAPAEMVEVSSKQKAIESPTTHSAHHVHEKKSHQENSSSNITGINVNKIIAVAESDGLQPRAVKSALNAYEWALHNRKIGNNKDIMTVVDFTLPSYEKRMWVLNLRENKVLMRLYTTQGSGSGMVYATRFSNRGHSQTSSLGLYTTSEEYGGKHGVSMRLDGLQYGINNNARNREIVIHDARYASAAYIRANHRAGRSWGCFAVDPAEKPRLLRDIRGGSVFFAYARPIESSSIVSHGPISL